MDFSFPMLKLVIPWYSLIVIPSGNYIHFLGPFCDFLKKEYPVMAGKHEMVSPITSIPIRVFMGNNLDIISNSSTQNSFVSNHWMKQVLKDHHNTVGKKVDMCFIWILSLKLLIDLQGVYENSFHGVYVLAGSIVK